MNRLRKQLKRELASSDGGAATALKAYRTLAVDLDLINKDDVDPDLIQLIRERINLMEEKAAEMNRYIGEWEETRRRLKQAGDIFPPADTQQKQDILNAIGNEILRGALDEVTKRHLAIDDTIGNRIAALNQEAAELGKSFAKRYQLPFED